MSAVALQCHGAAALDALLHFFKRGQLNACHWAIQVSQLEVQACLDVPGHFFPKRFVRAGQDVGPALGLSTAALGQLLRAQAKRCEIATSGTCKVGEHGGWGVAVGALVVRGGGKYRASFVYRMRHSAQQVTCVFWCVEIPAEKAFYRILKIAELGHWASRQPEYVPQTN